MSKEIQEILLAAARVVLTRRNNVTIEGAWFAAVEILPLLELDTMLAEHFDLDSAEVTFENVDDLIAKIRKL